MEHQVIAYQMEIVEERSAGMASYQLLRIVSNTLLKYAVAITDGQGSELALLQGEEEQVLAFFDQIAAGELSSLHLCEVAEDFCHAFAGEIF
jgi:hypothetical protein